MAFDLDDDELRATRKLNGVEWEEDKEIQVGDYVRTKKGYIDKIVIAENEDNMYAGESNPQYLDYEREDIAKHNPNLIDLIEKGDIIQIGNDKYEVIYDKSYEKLGILIPNKNFLSLRHCSLKYIFSKDGIEEFKKILIVTHEQFNSVMYKVKE